MLLSADYQFNEEALVNINPGLFSESVNNIEYADIACHKVLLSVLSQYADDHGKDYSVFEMESYYKSMFVEDGIWGIRYWILHQRKCFT